MEWVYDFQDINEIATKCWKESGDTTVLAFHGPVGAGKTTFIHALCEVKKVADSVASPTFSIINEYEYDEGGSNKKLYHIDLYRLKDEAEAIRAGVEDCFYSDHVCLVEWPEKAGSLLPPDTLHIYLEVINYTTRKLIITGKKTQH